MCVSVRVAEYSQTEHEGRRGTKVVAHGLGE